MTALDGSTRLRVRSLTSNTGDTVSVPLSGVTCFVGANNAGKSQLLRDVRAIISEADPRPRCLSGIEVLEPHGDIHSLRAFLERTASRTELADGEVAYGAPGTGNYTLKQIEGFLAHKPGLVGNPYANTLGPLFVAASSAGSLRDYATGHISTSDPINSSPLSKLFRNGDLEAAISDLALNAFGQPVILDRLSPSMVLRVGSVDIPVPPLNRPNPEYAAAISALPQIANEGDGFKSFIGLALHVLADSDLLLLVDEPEAFLHPAQARALGRWIAKQASERGCQIFLSTHDRDLLLGLVEGGTQVNVVRVERRGQETHLSQLPPEDVKEVWASPVLRYSNVLQGLFHAQVVICESDADCRFFSAALDELDERSPSGIADNTLFVPSGGKDRIHQLADALASLDVKTFAIADFDVLNKRATVKRIVESLGGAWTEKMQQDYVKVSSAVNGLASSADDGWQIAKNAGLSVVPSGAAHTAAESLLAELSTVGLVVLPMGEMEDFDKGDTDHGAPWVTAALDNGVHRATAVRETVRRLAGPAG